jgi:ribosomal protein S19
MAKEKSLDKRMMKLIRSFGGWVMKVHGNEFTGAGIPDLMGCIPVTITQEMVGHEIGIFFGIEDKRDFKSEPSTIQLQTIEEIKKARGYSKVVRSYDDGVAAIQEIRLVPEGSGRVPNKEAVLRSLHGAGYREDLGKFRNNRTFAIQKPTARRTRRRTTRKP